MSEINIGDTVRKNKPYGVDDSPMLVQGIEGEFAICVWTDEKGESRQQKFKLDELRSV
jgi:hypothetical protein